MNLNGLYFSSVENSLVMHHLLNDQICTMVISNHKLDDQVYGIERVVIYRQSLMTRREPQHRYRDVSDRRTQPFIVVTRYDTSTDLVI